MGGGLQRRQARTARIVLWRAMPRSMMGLAAVRPDMPSYISAPISRQAAPRTAARGVQSAVSRRKTRWKWCRRCTCNADGAGHAVVQFCAPELRNARLQKRFLAGICTKTGLPPMVWSPTRPWSWLSAYAMLASVYRRLHSVATRSCTLRNGQRLRTWRRGPGLSFSGMCPHPEPHATENCVRCSGIQPATAAGKAGHEARILPEALEGPPAPWPQHRNPGRPTRAHGGTSRSSEDATTRSRHAAWVLSSTHRARASAGLRRRD